jgi:hypothetical protein
MATVTSGQGIIKYFEDFLGAEIPIATNVGYGTTAGGCNYYIGDLAVKGDLADTDCGVVSLSKANGYARIIGTNETSEGLWVGTEVNLSPALNGTLVVEARAEMQALTARAPFIGFMGTVADNCLNPCTAVTVTLTPVAAAYCGFYMNDALTAATQWHFIYRSGTATASGATVTTLCGTGVVAVAAESQIFRVEIDPDGTARGYIDGVLEATVPGAVAPTTLFSAGIGVFATANTAQDIDVDYIAIEANRDWTV